MSNESDVTTSGQKGVRPGREATTGVHVGSPAPDVPAGAVRVPSPVRNGDAPGRARTAVGVTRDRRRDDPEFTSYYGLAVINQPIWEARDIAGYLFLGGLAGGSALIGAGAEVTGRRGLARIAKVGTAAAAGLSLVALVHDLGKPARFFNMLRVFKPTSPMNIGSWLLAAFAPAAFVSAGSEVTGGFRRLGSAATVGAAALGPALAAYTAVLVSNTAVPAWHDGYREMPFVFVASGAQAAAGLGLAFSPSEEVKPVRRLAVLAGAGEIAATKLMERRMGMVAEPYHEGKAGRYMRLAQVGTILGALGALLGGKKRGVAFISGFALIASSAFERFGIFHAGVESANDPKYTVVPQRQRLPADNH